MYGNTSSIFKLYYRTSSYVSQILLKCFHLKWCRKGLVMLQTINSIEDIWQFMQQTYDELKDKIKFDSDGRPIFQKKDFLNKIPEELVTFDYRNNSSITTPKSKTALAFFEPDKRIYPRLSKMKQDLPIYRQYAGVVFPDITITKDMDVGLQETLILANHLFAAYLVVNGIKVIFNTRTASTKTLEAFNNIPRGVMCASGFLGCKNATNFSTAADYTNKILMLLPGSLLIYGKHDKIIDFQLNNLGINYHYFQDFHGRSRLEAVA